MSHRYVIYEYISSSSFPGALCADVVQLCNSFDAIAKHADADGLITRNDYQRQALLSDSNTILLTEAAPDKMTVRGAADLFVRWGLCRHWKPFAFGVSVDMCKVYHDIAHCDDASAWQAVDSYTGNSVPYRILSVRAPRYMNEWRLIWRIRGRLCSRSFYYYPHILHARLCYFIEDGNAMDSVKRRWFASIVSLMQDQAGCADTTYA
jgi:hypothetical protein